MLSLLLDKMQIKESCYNKRRILGRREYGLSFIDEKLSFMYGISDFTQLIHISNSSFGSI